MSSTVPRCRPRLAVSGSSTARPPSISWSWGGKPKRQTIDLLRHGPASPDELEPAERLPLVDRAPRRSCPSSSKYRHQNDLSSRRCQSRSWASSQRACCSGRSSGSVGHVPGQRAPRASATCCCALVRASAAPPPAAAAAAGRRARAPTEVEPPLLEPVAQAPVAQRRRRGCSPRSRAGSPRRPRRSRRAASSSHVSNATMLEPASFESTSRSSPYSGSSRLIE